MNQPYFVVEFAHSVHGHAKRIQISYKWLAYLFGSFLLICLLAFGLFSSYLHMSWEVARYQQLRADLITFGPATRTCSANRCSTTSRWHRLRIWRLRFR